MIDLTTWGIIRPTETDASGALRRRFALYLLPAYLSDPVRIARACDEQIDLSGVLLGYIRDLANDPAVVKSIAPGLGRFDGTDTSPLPSPAKRRCLRCNQPVFTDAPTILCDGVVSKVVPFSTHEPVISAPHASAAWEVVE